MMSRSLYRHPDDSRNCQVTQWSPSVPIDGRLQQASAPEKEFRKDGDDAGYDKHDTWRERVLMF